MWENNLKGFSMKTHSYSGFINFRFLILGFLLLSLIPAFGQSNNGVPELITQAQHKQGLKSFWGKEVIKMTLHRTLGADTLQQADFVFEAHGGRSKMTLPNGHQVIFDGKEAWGNQLASEIPRGRFHVWTWPWFFISSFKMAGDGITLSQPQTIPFQGVDYSTYLQTFASTEGDAPDDWYRLFINPQSQRLEAMTYIVSYGKSQDSIQEAQQSIIYYKQFKTIDGVELPTQADFWYWDGQSNTKKDPQPKFSISFSNIEFLKSADVDFKVPEGYHHFPLDTAK